MTQPTITDADREAAKRWGLGPVYNIHLLENYFAAHRELGRIEGATAMQGDAAKWRALMACQRVRVMGFTNDGNHIGVEFWHEHPAAHPSDEYPQDACRERFSEFAALDPSAMKEVGE